MIHLFSLQLNPNATLFISGFDVEKDLIEFEIRNAEGQVLVPRHAAPVTILPEGIVFEGLLLPTPLVNQIFETLQSDVDAKPELRPSSDNATGKSEPVPPVYA